MYKPKVSVIIPVYNEEKYVESCLNSMHKQTLKPDETIIVNDGSTDNSITKIEKIKQELTLNNLILLNQRHQGAAKARNFGASKARGNILIFLDADMTYDKDFVKKIIQPIINGKAIATFAQSEYVVNLDNSWAKLWDQDSFANEGVRITKNQNQYGKTFRAIKANMFHQAGDFTNSGFNDDVSVLTKLNKKSLAVNQAVCYHYNPSSLTEVYYSARWMGRDSGNQGKLFKFLVFSPFWSLMKATWGVFKIKNWLFFPFRLVFDFGYFIGLVDINLRNIHYK